jgi:peptidoglycan hydrolase-like protein with peptidoglycan-binding domain
MPSFRASQALLLLCTLAITPAFASRTHRAPTSGHSRMASSKKGKRSQVSRVRGQRTIDSDRATEIQTALIHKNYLSGEPSGQWDSQTQEAMRQYQSDHGWQTKLTPDSRALISLGLGPKQAAPAPAARTASTSQEELTTQAQSTEPAENTLAATHTISQ